MTQKCLTDMEDAGICEGDEQDTMRQKFTAGSYASTCLTATIHKSTEDVSLKQCTFATDVVCRLIPEQTEDTTALGKATQRRERLQGPSTRARAMPKSYTAAGQHPLSRAKCTKTMLF